MELLSNINKIAFFFLAVKKCAIWCFLRSTKPRPFLISWMTRRLSLSYHVAAVELVSFPVSVRCTISAMPEVTSDSEGELSGTCVVVVLWLSDVGVGVHGEVDFLQV